MTNSQTRWLLLVVAVVIMGLVGYSVLTAPDQRDAGQKIGDALDELPNGVDNAARELGDRTPADKIGDAVDDATD